MSWRLVLTITKEEREQYLAKLAQEFEVWQRKRIYKDQFWLASILKAWK